MATITEDYVSFEIAKLLKEKGFDARCPMIYTADGEMLYTDVKHHNMYAVTNKQLEYCTDIIAPTLQIAMKWLREVHNIDIIAPPQYNNVEWTYSAIIVKLSIPCTEIRLNDNKDKKEEAYEAAIKYCLEHLI